jgi:hypothetical protein
MFGFLGFLLIIFLGFTILGNILRVLFGIGKHPPYQNRTSTHQKQNTYTQTQTNDENENFAEFSSSSSNRHSHSSGNRKKIFDDDEGEYVDYEEVK